MSHYVMGMAISDARMLSDEDGMVKFTSRKRNGEQGRDIQSLPRQEFMDRYVSHILPPGMFRARYRGIFSSREIPNLAHVRECIALANPQAVQTITAQLIDQAKVVAVDGSEEFSGERAGATTYRCVCPHDKTPMVKSCRAKGPDTMRYLGYLRCVIRFLKGLVPSMPEERPAGLPYQLARFAEIAETAVNESGEAVTTTRTVSIEYALQQKLHAAFNKAPSSRPPPGSHSEQVG